MTEAPGRVLLFDARGCSLFRRVQTGDRFANDGATFRLRGNMWASIPFEHLGEFHQVGDARIPVYVSRKPAVGPKDAPWSPLYLPFGWCKPGVLQASAR